MRVRDDLRGVEGAADVVDELVAVGLDDRLRPAEFFRGGDALLLHCGDAAGKDRLTDKGDRDALFGGVDQRPFAGAFLAGGVENLLDQRFAIVVLVGEDISGDLDEVRVEVALVPLGEHLVHLVGAHAEPFLHQVVRLADELHVAVLDAVVHHLDVVPGAVVANPVAARRPVIDLG